jgi:hypothetical protein
VRLQRKLTSGYHLCEKASVKHSYVEDPLVKDPFVEDPLAKD